LNIPQSLASANLFLEQNYGIAIMSDHESRVRGGRIGDRGRSRQLRYTARVLSHASKAALRRGPLLPRRQRGHISPSAPKRGMGTGARAAAGLIGRGGRRVVVKARYTRIFGGDLGAARAHLRYIQRDGVTREGASGELYDASRDSVDVAAFLRRSQGDPYQFRFIVSVEDSARMGDLKPFVRDLLRQMQYDLDTKLDWVGVDHFNTGHPHTHIVIRGRDLKGKDLVMARSYITHGVRARAEGLIGLELGPESALERLQKLGNEVEQERLTRIDRALVARAKDGIVVVGGAAGHDPLQQTLRIGRLRALERLGLAVERRPGVWALDAGMEGKLRRLGERADKFKTLQRALHEAGIERAASSITLFAKSERSAPLIGKVVGVGMVDEITDRTWVVVDAVDGRAHYAELGRLDAGDVPGRGMLVALGGGRLQDKPDSYPRFQLLSSVGVEQLIGYDGPTWLDSAIVGRLHLERAMPGFAAELRGAITERGRWLETRGLAEVSSDGTPMPKPQMLAILRRRETRRMAEAVSRELDAGFTPHLGGRIHGIYERAIVTPTGRIAVIRRDDTFTLAPWRPALEPMRGRAVIGFTGSSRMTWTLDRGRGLPDRT
jgi:type IV secretory pathway VirD2 relaxase